MEKVLGEFDALVAFVLPGMALLFGLSPFSPTIEKWFGNAQHRSATLAGAFLLLVTALGAGLLLEALRVHTVEWINHHTGVVTASWDLSIADQARQAQYIEAIENYYVYAQFYGNVFLAVAISYVVRMVSSRRKPWPLTFPDYGVVLLLVSSWLGGRTDLESYYSSVRDLLY